jgi:SAM-dependent methyltransferase
MNRTIVKALRMAGETGWSLFERAGWENHVEPYHAFFGPISERIAPPLLDAAGVASGMRVLDVCCGPGYAAGAAAVRGAAVWGVDIAENMVRRAAQLHPDVSFRTADAAALPFADDHFDAIVCNFGIHHLADPQAGMAEFARVLRPGGKFAFTVWDEERSGLSVVPDAVYRPGVVIPNDMPSPPEVANYDSVEEARPLLEAAGLTLVTVSSLAFAQSYADADALWDGWLAAAIRTQPILAHQSAEAQQRARATYDEAVRTRFSDGTHVEVPVAVVIVSGQRPSDGQ